MRHLVFALALLAAAPVGAQTHTIIALSHNNHTIYEVDPATGRIVHELVVPDQPHEGAVSPDGRTIYASIPQGPMVVVLDAATFAEKGRIESEHFRRTPQARPPSGVEGERRINTSASPHGVALTGDGSKLYIGVENADVPGIVVYDTKSGRVVKKIDLLLRGGHYLQIQPGTDKLYYPHRNDNRVVVLDTKADRILKVIPVEGGPVGVAFAPNGDVWLHEDGDGSVTVVDSKKDEVIKVIQTGGKGAGRIAVSPDGRYAASTHNGSGDVAIIDAVKQEMIANVKIGKGPGFPLFSPDSAKLYVMESGEGDIVVVDVKALSVAARHKVGTNPFGGALRIPGAKRTSSQQ
jgi:YVTN family beta-propeller protein